MSKPIDQEREVLASELLARYLRDLRLRTFPDNDEGDYNLRWTAGEIKRVEKAIAASRAAVQPAGVAVPKGWKLVPVAPTPAILDAIDLLCDDHKAFVDSDAFWSYLIDAAPHPVSGEQKPIGKVLSEEEMGIAYDRKAGPVLWFGQPAPGFIYAAPPAAQDVSGLVEALESVIAYDESAEDDDGSLMIHYADMLKKVRTALAARRAQAQGGDV